MYSHFTLCCSTFAAFHWSKVKKSTVKFTGRSSLPDYSTQQVHGTASPRQLTVDVLTYCWNVQNVTATVCQTCQLLKNCVTLQMINCLTKLFPTSVVFYTPSCHHHPYPRSTTTSGVVHKCFHCPDMSRICQTATLPLGCRTNTAIKLLSPVFTFY